MALKYSFILEAVDRASAITRRVSAAVERSSRQSAASSRRAAQANEAQGRSLEHLRRRAERMRRVALGRTFQAAADSARRLGRHLQGIPGRLRMMERAGKAAKGALGWLGGAAVNAAKWAGAAAIGGAGFAIFDMFKVASQFEQYEVMLEGLTGSNAKAKESMRWVQDFAKSTPYELDQVMASFVSLKSYGIDPVNGALRTLGDAASAMGKPLDQAVDMMADATTFEYERLKEFGIRAKDENGKVTFSYMQNGKQMVKSANKTASGVQSAILGIFDEKFGGGMARQAKTMNGLISNLKDQWSGFLLMIADAGVFEKVKGKLEQWSSKIAEMAADGRLEAWAERISDRLGEWFDKTVEWVDSGGMERAVTQLNTILTVVSDIADMITTIQKRWELISWANPVGKLSGMAIDGYDAAFGDGSGASPARAPAGRSTMPKSPARPYQFGRGPQPLGTATTRPKFLGAAKPRPKITAANGNSKVDVGGKMDIAIKVDGGNARLAGVSSTGNVPVKATLKRGTAMA